MILIYALGGGLGHLTRARAVVHTLGLRDVVLLTASPFAADPRVVGELPVIAVPPALNIDRDARRRWLADLLAGLRPDELYIDAFPAGIGGELRGLKLPPTTYLARLLRWKRYAPLLEDYPGVHVDRTALLEDLTPEHAAWAARVSASIGRLELQDPPAAPVDLAALRGDGQLWLIVHAGAAEETGQLVRYALDQRDAEGGRATIVLIAPQRPAGLPPEIRWLDLYPIAPALSQADRIISACGFNLMRQAAPHAAIHRPHPFPRRFDNQFLRAARWRLKHRGPQHR